MILNIPPERITANPWQTRRGEPAPADYVKDLALDIAQNGLLQIPVGRLVGDNGLPVDTHGYDMEEFPDLARMYPESLRCQLAFGHGRLAAYRWLIDNQPGDFSMIPVDVQMLTDEQMATFAWSENEKRLQHSPIDRAHAIQKRIDDFGWSHQQVAERLGVSRPVVSNTLRLLSLPANVQDMLIKGDISERMGVALIGLYELPEMLRDAAKDHYSYYDPESVIRRVVAGQITQSDTVREIVKSIIEHFAKNLKDAPWKLDEYLDMQRRSLYCRDCAMRFKDKNLCVDLKCYMASYNAWCKEQLQVASTALGIPVLEDDRMDWNGHTHFLYNPAKSYLSAIKANGCPNLRVKYSAGDGSVDGFPDVQLVCCKREQYCTCLQGRKRVEADVRSASRLTANNLLEITRNTRLERREAQSVLADLKQETAERIATGLSMGKRETWKRFLLRLTGDDWRMDGKPAKLADGEMMWDIKVAVAMTMVQHYAPIEPKLTQEIIDVMNTLLAQCGLEPLEANAEQRVLEINARLQAEQDS